MTIAGILEWLEGTAVGILVRESPYGFPFLVAVHILGLALSVGTLLWVDLRLLGLALRRAPLSEVYRTLAPWFLAGFGVMFVSGALLFTAFATSAYGNLYFRIKMAAILLAGVNALVYHVATERFFRGTWDAAPRPPAAARVVGFVSLALWATVIVSGRLISYTLFSIP